MTKITLYLGVVYLFSFHLFPVDPLKWLALTHFAPYVIAELQKNIQMHKVKFYIHFTQAGCNEVSGPLILNWLRES